MRPLLAPWLLLVALGATPAAARPARHRFHQLAPRLVERLAAPTQAALRGVATLRSATGFVIHEDGHGKALLLTNEHVTRGGVAGGEPVTFHDGTTARIARVLATHPGLDYALVEIDLPETGAPRALALEPAGLQPGRAIYTIAGHANLAFREMHAAVGGGGAAHRAIRAQGTNHFAIAEGEVDRKATAAGAVSVVGAQILGKLARIPNSPGMSGSPILAKDTHAVVALHSSGNARPRRWRETSIPLGLILQDLDIRSRSGVFDAAGQAMVRRFLGAQP